MGAQPPHPSTSVAPTHTSTAPPLAPPPPPAAGSTYETVFTNAKAGMADVDRDHVRQVVFDMSKDSAHYQNEMRKAAATEERIRRMRAQAAALLPAELEAHAAAVDKQVAELEATRDLGRIWIHVDMDAFFASVAELANPSLKGRPFAVGGIGMISTASYEARKYGVRSAMPGFIALKLCPELIFVPSNFESYKQAAALAREVFRKFDPDIHSWSLDEAALDVTQYCDDKSMKNINETVTGAQVAEEIRAGVFEATKGLTCSCGIGPNRTLAKICSDMNKPNGQYVLDSTREAVMDFVATLPVRKVPGVGRVSEQVLKSMGVELCGDILEHKAELSALFSATSLEFFLQCALGLGPTAHPEPVAEGEVGRKGISCERTFRPISSRADLESRCKELAEHLAEDMAQEGLRGKTLTLKLKLSTFELRTRAVTLGRYISSVDDILEAALRLLRAELPVEVRLMGLRMSNFWEEPRREPGQFSIVEILERRKQRNSSHVDERDGESKGGVEGSGKRKRESLDGEGEHEDVEVDDEEVHSSQMLSAAEDLELTLQDWNAEERKEERKEEMTAGIGNTALPGTSKSNNAQPSPLQSPKPPPRPPAATTWQCAACTFENPKNAGWCEMCSTSRSGWRPATQMQGAATEGSKGPEKKRGKGQRKTGTGSALVVGAGNILDFCKPKAQQK